MPESHSLVPARNADLEQRVGRDALLPPSGTEQTRFVQSVNALGPSLGGLAEYLKDKQQWEVDAREKQARPHYHRAIVVNRENADAIVRFLNDFVGTTHMMGGTIFADMGGRPEAIYDMLEQSRTNSLRQPHLEIDVTSGVDMCEPGGRGYAKRDQNAPPLTYTDVKVRVIAYTGFNSVPDFAAKWRIYVPAGKAHAFFGSGRGTAHDFDEQAVRKLIEFDEQYPVIEHNNEPVGPATLAMRMLGEYCQKMIERPKGGGFLLK